MIPKKILTIWLSENPVLPPLIQRCIDSQKIHGYEHKIITLKNCDWGSIYMNEAMDEYYRTKKVKYLVKASDYLRCWHIWKEGGIYLDADMEVLPGKNFDDLLDCRFFTEYEVYGYAANAGFGSEADHPFLKQYIEDLCLNYKGDGPMVFEPGIRQFSDTLWRFNQEANGMLIRDTNLFFPYHHGTGEVKITDDTRVIHHYAKSWTDTPKDLS